MTACSVVWSFRVCSFHWSDFQNKACWQTFFIWPLGLLFTSWKSLVRFRHENYLLSSKPSDITCWSFRKIWTFIHPTSLTIAWFGFGPTITIITYICSNTHKSNLHCGHDIKRKRQQTDKATTALFICWKVLVFRSWHCPHQLLFGIHFLSAKTRNAFSIIHSIKSLWVCLVWCVTSFTFLLKHLTK